MWNYKSKVKRFKASFLCHTWTTTGGY